MSNVLFLIQCVGYVGYVDYTLRFFLLVGYPVQSVVLSGFYSSVEVSVVGYVSGV